MENTLRDLITNGFIIRPSGTGQQWYVEKSAVMCCPNLADSVVCETYEEAISMAQKMLDSMSNKFFEFTAIIRYNRGLGVEYKNLPIIQAKSIDEARILAETEAINLLGEVDIGEIRIRPVVKG